MPAVLSKIEVIGISLQSKKPAQALASLDAGCDAKHLANYIKTTERWDRI